MIIVGIRGERQRFSMPREENHQVRHATMIDIGIGGDACGACTRPFFWICGNMVRHVLVNFFLQIDPNRAIDANYFVRADSSRSGHISTWIRYANISRIIPNDMLRALDCNRHEAVKKLLLKCGQSSRSCGALWNAIPDRENGSSSNNSDATTWFSRTNLGDLGITNEAPHRPLLFRHANSKICARQPEVAR